MQSLRKKVTWFLTRCSGLMCLCCGLTADLWWLSFQMCDLYGWVQDRWCSPLPTLCPYLPQGVYWWLAHAFIYMPFLHGACRCCNSHDVWITATHCPSEFIEFIGLCHSCHFNAASWINKSTLIQLNGLNVVAMAGCKCTRMLKIAYSEIFWCYKFRASNE